MASTGIFRPGMRGYFVPFVAGVVLCVSAFLPWVVVGDVSMRGVPDVPALWIAGLGAIAAVLALLSLITRSNKRTNLRLKPLNRARQRVPLTPQALKLPTRRLKLPGSLVWLDAPWESAFNDFRMNPVQFPDEMGRKIVENIVKYSKGEDVPPEILIPTRLYRKEDALKDPSLK